MKFVVHFFVAAALVVGDHAAAQDASVGAVTQQAFVVGVVPVAGNGAVGGVAIDANGVIAQAEERDVVALRDARRNATSGLAADITRRSALRKISLRRLDTLLARHASQNKPLSSEILYLAGLQRVEYVFAYPDLHDIVLAGPAEGWGVDDRGNIVGTNSGAAALHLVDLIAALRTKDQMLAGKMISCSIDPTAVGLKQFARLVRGSPSSPSPELLRRMEQTVGPQTITLSGMAPESHFAQVLVAADWQMKRIGMGLVPSPVDGLTSYLELLNDGHRSTTRNSLPRWWIAYGKQPVEHDADGLGWRISRPGIQVCTAAGRMDHDGRILTQIESDPTAKKWADSMTRRYDQLAIVEPVFGQLRGCMDLALATAILASSDLLTHVQLELPMLLDDRRLQLAAHRIPKNVPSHASAFRKGRTWMVSVSGGVELDVQHPIDAAELQVEVREARLHASPKRIESWWWD
ncbi:MAG TPA: DUF1598 domain-containing protein [Pirellulales bacterium]|jgi:hypothetical protein|nr:DUF1598 domain-containing protein [Pirellulales bacterium]